jgi:hypothetical protein
MTSHHKKCESLSLWGEIPRQDCLMCELYDEIDTLEIELESHKTVLMWRTREALSPILRRFIIAQALAAPCTCNPDIGKQCVSSYIRERLESAWPDDWDTVSKWDTNK